MKRKQSDQDRARHQYAELTKHYRAIGPAAILAALICAPKKDKTAPKLNKAA
ncbi:transcriptional regulator [Aminobacter sp. BA135]|uniref:transcriptional regulator n=1 Tax=Aminobacter sp. BA135 TaxID=537596 RepID=UPI003D791D20